MAEAQRAASPLRLCRLGDSQDLTQIFALFSMLTSATWQSVHSQYSVIADSFFWGGVYKLTYFRQFKTMSGSTDDIKPVICTVKPPVYLQIGDNKTDAVQSGVCVVDVSLPFGKPVSIEEISFKNYYTAYVTVRLLRRTPGQEASAKWCTVLRDLPLMDNPHTERGSQDYVSIHRTQMRVEPDHVVCVRLILRQPSSAWQTFSLQEIKLYPYMEPDPEKEVSDWLSDLTVVDKHPDLEGLPDPQTVSSSIQQMWALTEVMQSSQTTASIGRFDVDGCYDVNLLSLT